MADHFPSSTESPQNDGDHRICCLPCGHIYGISCVQKWLKQYPNEGKCPQCNKIFTDKDVRKLFASQVVAIDKEAHKRIKSLQNKCASTKTRMRHETVVSSTLQRIAETISARAAKSRSGSVSAISRNALLMECKKILESMDLEMSLYIRTMNMMVNHPT